MTDDLKLSLNRPGPRGPRGGGLYIPLVILIVLAAAGLFLQISGGRGGRSVPDGGLPAAKIEELAIRLERENLPGAAARAWIDYLESARPADVESARIWYRIGKIRHDSGDYEGAIEAYYRSESLAELKEIGPGISRRIAECLEGLGAFAALRYELEKRTALAPSDSTGGGEVIAEIGPWKITNSELDMMIESEIDDQLLQVGAALSPEEKRLQKEKFLESVLKGRERNAWLERFIAEELLYRRAREEKFHETPEVRTFMNSIGRKLLAQKYLERKIGPEIKVAPDELTAYYEAHVKDFEEDGVRKPFEDVKDRVYMAVRREKEMELQQRILDELKDRYDVVVHYSKLGK